MSAPPHPITIPLLNPNEPNAFLAELHIEEGQHVRSGQPLCTLETTKSTAELTAEAEGYVTGLRFRQGQSVPAGEILCYLSESPQASAPERPSGDEQIEVPSGLRISQPALALARQNHLDLSELPLGPLVTEGMVRTMLERRAGRDFSLPQSEYDSTAIVVYGGGGHGKILIDLLRALGTYRIFGVVDDGLSPERQVMGLPVLGGAEVLPDLHAQGVRQAVNAVGGIGNISVRINVFRRLAAAGYVFPALVHPKALVEPGARLSAGAQILAQAYIGSEARVGFGVIVSTGAIVSHDCILNDYVNISPGAILAGEVQVDPGALIGMGATVNLQVRIGAGARIGNGATVKADVPEQGVVRAGTIWPE